MSNSTGKATVVISTKNMGVGILLTILFGPLGMLYATIPGAIIMIILFAVIGFATVGMGLLLLWPICIIWTAISIKKYNDNLVSK